MNNKIAKTSFSIISRILQFIALFVLIGLIFATVIGAMLGISIVRIAKDSPKVNPENILLSLDQNSKIFDKNGNLIESIAYEEYREIINIKDIPKHLKNAFIAIEDERFLKHKGVDPRSIIRAFIDNMKTGDIVQGGSTITQQLVKNVYLTNEVKWERKIMEMYIALQIETEISKDKILEGYLNRVFFGQNAYGVEVAAQTYFNKHAKDLNLAQCATLASMVQSPSAFALFETYPPSSVPKDAKVIGEYKISGMDFVAVANDTVIERKNVTLQKMLELEMITKEEYNEALKFDVMASVKPTSKEIEYPSNIASLIKKQAVEKIMDSQKVSEKEALNLLYTGGLSIVTTIDWDVQKKLEETYDNFAKILGDYNGWGRQPLLGNLNFDENGDIISKKGNKLYYKKGNLLTNSGKVYIPKDWYSISENGDLTTKSSRIFLSGEYLHILPYYTINDNNELVTYRVGSIQIPSKYTKKNNDGGFTIKAEYFKKINDFYSKNSTGDLILNPNYYTVETEGTVQPQSASVVLDSKTAEIVGIVSKRGHSKDDTIDRATNYFRSPASTMKPLAAYAPALQEGKTLASPMDDTPMLKLDDSTVWPSNVDLNYRGIVTIREALRDSINTVAVKLMYNELGIKKSMEYLEKFGIINAEHPERDNFITKKENLEHNDEIPSMAIGGLTKGLTPLDMASAYQTFANKGERIQSSIISKITSRKKGDIYVNKHKPIRVISEQNNFLISDVMHDIANAGYILGNQGNGGMWTAGKTGTNNDQIDFYFTAFNHYYTAATWVGFDNQNIEMTGNSSVASQLYYAYMNKLTENKENVDYERPAGIVTSSVTKIDGKLPSSITPNQYIYNEYFAEGTEPTEASTSFVSALVDKRNNLLAPQNLPKFLQESRVFIERPIPYDPSEFNYVVPNDWKLRAPTEYSNLPVKEETTTKTLPDGTKVTTTTRVNGNVEVLTTKPDGSQILQITTPDGKVTTKNINAGQNNQQNNGNSNTQSGTGTSPSTGTPTGTRETNRERN